MQDEYNPNNPALEEEEGIDIVAILKDLWEGRKTIIITTAVFMVLGLVAALTMQRTWSVSTIMVPQMSSSKNSSLSSLASLAGFDLGMTQTADLSPLSYPQIVESVPFKLELIHTPLHYSKADTAVSMLTYQKEYVKPTVIGTVLKYTVGLPGVILGAISGKKEPITLPGGEGDGGPRPMVLTEDEEKMLKLLGGKVSLAVEKKEGYLTLTVGGIEPVQTAELALKAQQLLQEEVTRFRTEKAQAELDYIQARYDEIKQESEAYQNALAVARDRSQNFAMSRSQVTVDRLQSKYAITNSVFAEMAKQLEQAKMQVKKDTPVFTIIQPVVVPTQPSNSRAKTLIVWTFLGGVLGCGLVLAKGYWPKVKAMFAKKEEEEEEKK